MTAFAGRGWPRMREFLAGLGGGLGGAAECDFYGVESLPLAWSPA